MSNFFLKYVLQLYSSLVWHIDPKWIAFFFLITSSFIRSNYYQCYVPGKIGPVAPVPILVYHII